MKQMILHYLNKFIIHDKDVQIVYDDAARQYIYKEKISASEFNRLKGNCPGKIEKQKNSHFKVISSEQFVRLITCRIRSILRTSRVISFICNTVFYIFSVNLNSRTAVLFFPISYFVLYMLLRFYFDKFHFRIFLQCSEIMKYENFFTSFNDKIKTLFQSDLVCSIEFIEKNKNMKYYGGSSELYTRHPMKLSSSMPPFIISSTKLPLIKYADNRVWIFPDFLFFNENGIYKTIVYSSSLISYKEKIFYEYIFNPADSKKVGEKWLYQKKNGERDRRFKNNRKIPVMVYGELIISSKEHISLKIQISNIKTAHKLAVVLKQYAAYYEEELYYKQKMKTGKSAAKQSGKSSSDKNQKKQNADYKKNENPESDELWAYTILGVPVNASEKEIKKAYRNLVQLHHPDKHRTKDKETYEKAEYNMKLINNAYEYLLKDS